MIKTVGDHSFSASLVDLDERIKIGKYTLLAADVIFNSGDINHPSLSNRQLVSNYLFREYFNIHEYPPMAGKGPIIIGNDVWVGEGARLLSGVTIGDGAIIGAGAVVAKDVPPYAVAVGNPIIVKRFRFSPETISKLLKIKWWDWSDDIIKQRMNDFMDIDRFTELYG